MQYEQLSPNAISYFNGPSNLGGYWSLRLFYSADIVQQEFQSDTELDAPVKFKYSEKVISTWLPKQFVLEPTMGIFFDENGFAENHEIKLIIDARGQEDIFKKWFRKYLQGKRICLELTTMNKVVTLYNPMFATYSYVSASEFSGTATYEITFARTKFLAFDFLPIKNIEVTGGKIYQPNNAPAILWSEIAIEFNPGVSLDFVEILIGTTEELEDAEPCSLLENRPDGEYWIFAVCKADKSIYYSTNKTLESAKTVDLVLQ